MAYQRYSTFGLLFITFACAPTITNSESAQQANYMQAMGGPTHAPTSPQQWTQLDEHATSLANQDRMNVLPSEHLVKQGATVERRFNVTGGHCYTAGIAWAFNAHAEASVTYQPRSDGQPVNDSLGGAQEKLQGGSGALNFCADRDGEALLTISALSPEGTMAMNELLEFAFVLGEKEESSDEAAARRTKDQAAGAQARATIDANIAEAEERKRRNFEEQCRKCRLEFIQCKGQSGSKPSGSVSTSCEHQFRLCVPGPQTAGTPKDAECAMP